MDTKLEVMAMRGKVLPIIEPVQFLSDMKCSNGNTFTVKALAMSLSCRR